MLQTVFVASAVVATFLVLRLAIRFYTTLQAVRRSNLPYYIVPIHSMNRAIEVLRPFWWPLVERLPDSWKEGNGYMHSVENKVWHYGYGMFSSVKHDTYITVTWFGDSELWTADANIISNIVGRKVDFPKPLRLYAALELYGRNVVSTEGHDWRRHRKIVGPPFSEKNNHLVWAESVHSTKSMMTIIMNGNSTASPTVDQLAAPTSYLALAVISRAGYGVRLGWKDASGKTQYFEEEGSAETASTFSNDWIEGKTDGHTMSFGEALFHLDKNIILNLLVPEWLLDAMPFDVTRTAARAYREWDSYMKEMLRVRREELGSSAKVEQQHDLLASLVRQVGSRSGPVTDSKGASKERTDASGLSDSEIMGNAFVMMIAGHETTAGVLEHALYMLALDLPEQRRLHADLDRTVGDKPPGEWTYEHDFPRLFESLPGAILAEVLRLIPPAPAPPKWCPNVQTLTVDGRQCTIPAKTEIGMNLVAAHRNPRFWPCGKRDPKKPIFGGYRTKDDGTDLSEFKPERWLQGDGGSPIGNAANGNGRAANQPGEKVKAEDEGLQPGTGSETAASFFKPPRGAYLPFSEGFRSCIGRRFSQVEFVAVLAVIFQTYSIELAVDRYASDEEVGRMAETEKKKVWNKARDRAIYAFGHSMEMRITQKMLSDSVPVRFVKRGSERFGKVDA